MNADQIKAQYPGYQSWNDRASIEADFKATGGAGKGGPTPSYSTAASSVSGGVNDVIGNAKALNQVQVEANQPAISAYESSKQPLKDRYANLLNSLKGQQTTETNRQTVTTQNELGRRGIQGGGVAEQTLTDALNPITSAYTNKIADTGIAQEQDLADIQKAIATLQSGNMPQAFTTAQNLYQLENRKPSTQVVSAGGRQILVNTDTGAVLKDLGASSSSTSGISWPTFTPISNTRGGGQTFSAGPAPNYSPKGGEGSKSAGWIYHNGEWMINTEA